MRDRGQYRVARLRSPMTLRAAEQLNNRRIDADVTEDWSDVLHERDGAVARDLSGRLERHYVLESVADGWRIIEARPAVPG